MTQDYDIKEYSVDDLDDLYRLVQETIVISYSVVYPHEAVEAFIRYHSREQMQNDAEEGYTVILRVDDKIVGTGTLLDTSIKRVFIHPSYQGKGYGKAVIAMLEKKAAAQGVGTLDLAASLVSKQFYNSLGDTGDKQEFVPVGNGEKLYFYPMTKTL